MSNKIIVADATKLLTLATYAHMMIIAKSNDNNMSGQEVIDETINYIATLSALASTRKEERLPLEEIISRALQKALEDPNFKDILE